jgi:hypothetical protein
MINDERPTGTVPSGTCISSPPRVGVTITASLNEIDLILLQQFIRATVREELAAHLRDELPTLPTAAALGEEQVISVRDLAKKIGQTESATRRLLVQGRIPGARRKDPSKTNSHWLIPASAPALYLAAFFRRTRGQG